MGNNPNQSQQPDQNKKPNQADSTKPQSQDKQANPQGQDKNRMPSDSKAKVGSSQDGGDATRKDKSTDSRNPSGNQPQERQREDAGRSGKPGAALPSPKTPNFGDVNDPRTMEVEAKRKGAQQNPADAGE